MLGMGLVVKVYFSTRDTYTYTSGCAIYGVCASGNLSLSSNTDIKAFFGCKSTPTQTDFIINGNLLALKWQFQWWKPQAFQDLDLNSILNVWSLLLWPCSPVSPSFLGRTPQTNKLISYLLSSPSRILKVFSLTNILLSSGICWLVIYHLWVWVSPL